MSWEEIEQALAGAPRVSSSGHIRVNCPYCFERVGKQDRKQCLSVHVESGFFKCWRCNIKGRLHGEYDDWQPQEKAQVKNEEVSPPEGYVSLSEYCMSADPARAYLEGRGLRNRKLWQDAEIGCCISGRYYGRVVVPILAIDKRWLGWVARAWVKHANKTYLNAPGMSLGATGRLFNESILLEQSTRPVFVVEGVFDALALWPDAVAVLGKPTDSQVDTLRQASRPLVMLLDGDAWEEAEMLAMRLQLDGVHAGWVRLPPRVDPDEVDKQWLTQQAQIALGG